MNSQEYKTQRELRGTQVEVAEKLGTTQVTIARRETGVVPITREAELALLSLPKKRKRHEPAQQ
jgi:hypothetical protein